MTDHLITVLAAFARIYPVAAKDMLALHNADVVLTRSVIYPNIIDTVLHVGYLLPQTTVRVLLVRSPFSLHPFETSEGIRLTLQDVGIAIPAHVSLRTLQIMEVLHHA